MAQPSPPNTIVISMPQATVDRAFHLGSDLTTIVKEILEQHSFPLPDEVRTLFSDVKQAGLNRDRLSRLDDKGQNDPDPAQFLSALKGYLIARGRQPVANLGGNPAIMALRAYYLRSPEDIPSPLPHVKYSGLLPQSVIQFIKEQPELQRSDLARVFDDRVCHSIDDVPETLALESDYKIILAYGPGRTLEPLQGQISEYVIKLARATTEYGRIVVALSIAFPLETTGALIDHLREHFGRKLLIFVGCSSLREGAELKSDRVTSIREQILRKANIISMNEQELNDLDTILVGKGGFRDVSLASKIKELPFSAIKVCHSAAGAIMDVGCNPEEVIDPKQLGESPSRFLRESLQLAVDGATYAIDSIGHGRSANLWGVRIYSDAVSSRSEGGFDHTFLNVLERKPGGILTAQAPLVSRPLSAVTGVGAMFDGLLVSLLMRS